MRTITYGVLDDGLVVSRVDNQYAIPVLDWDHMTPDNSFEIRYQLEKGPITDLAPMWDYIKWTRKIPKTLKNKHRAFWGFKPLT